MKHAFLLDETILIRSIIGNPQALELWKLIRKNCHKIVMDSDWKLAGLYWKRLRRERSRMEVNFPTFPALLNHVLTNSEKHDVRQASGVPEEKHIRHQNDHFLLSILANGGGYLVTTDSQTRTDFNKDEISRHYNIKGLTIEQALSLARQV